MVNQHVANVITYFKKCESLIKYATRGNTERVIELIHDGADIHYENDAALRYGAERGHVHTVVALLEHGANVHAEEDYALRYSITHNSIETVRALLGYGANVHADNDAALMRCAEGHVHAEIMELLLEYNFTQESIDEALIHAANGNIRIVELLLTHGANVRAHNDKALFSNIYNDHVSVVELLLEYGNVREIAVDTLANCARRGQIEMIKILLKINPNAKDTDGTILHAGVNGGHLEMVTELLNWGSRVCASIFLTAIRNGNLAIVIKLLDNGADAYINDTPALSYSIYFGYFEIMMELLRRGANLEFIYDDIEFRVAAFVAHDNNSYTNIINGLLELNADVDILNNMLLLVTKIGHHEGVDLLLKNGADPCYKNNWILQWAVLHCNLEYIIKLLKYGVDISSVSSIVLRIGIRNGDLSMVTKLLELGADIQTLTKDTFLNQHCPHIKFQIIIKLLRAGANVGMLDTLEDAPLVMGSVCDLDLKTIEELLSYGVSVHICGDIFLQYCAQNGHVESCKELLGNGADVHARDDVSLISSVSYNHLDVVMLLLEHGANVHAKNDEALCYAAANDCLDTVTVLLEYGANVNARCDYPLRYSAAKGYATVVTKLLEHGANVHSKDDEALSYSVTNGHIEIVKILLANGALVKTNILTQCFTNNRADIIAALLECGANANANDNTVIMQHAISGNYDIVAKLLEYNTDAHIESLR